MRKIVNRKINYLLGTIVTLTMLFGVLNLRNNLSTKEIKVCNQSKILAANESTVEDKLEKYIYLSDYDWVSASNGYTGPVQKDIGQQKAYTLGLKVDGVTRN